MPYIPGNFHHMSCVICVHHNKDIKSIFDANVHPGLCLLGIGGAPNQP